MARRSDTYVVKITHSCTPDPKALERGLRMWAAFHAENLRRQARSRVAQAQVKEG